MSDNFYTIVTKRGHERITASMSGGAKVRLTHMGIGDANGTYYEPNETQVSLVNERYRVKITQLAQNDVNKNWFVAEALVPSDIGGFYIREVGLYDSEGHLFAVGKIPETYKPILPSGTDKELFIRLIFKISNSENVEIVLDPSVEIITEDSFDEGLKKAINGLDWKPTVKAASTENITLKGLQSIDEVVLKAGDRVLVKDQANAKENGLYVVSAQNWTRTEDCKGKISPSFGLLVSVSGGKKQKNTVWLLPVNKELIIGSDQLIFQTFQVGDSNLSLGDHLNLIHVNNSCSNINLKNRTGFLSHAHRKNQDAIWKDQTGYDARASLLMFDHLGQLANYFSEHTSLATSINWTNWKSTVPAAAAHLVTREILDLRLRGMFPSGIGSFVLHPTGNLPANTILLTSTLQYILYDSYKALCDVIGETYGPKESRPRQVNYPAYHDPRGDMYGLCSCSQIHDNGACPWGESGNPYLGHNCTSSCTPAYQITVYDAYYAIPTILFVYGGALPPGMAISIVAR